MKWADMPKEDRIKLLLSYLDDNEVALPPRVLHENLIMFKNSTSSYRTIQRYLQECVDRGLVEPVERNKTYYRITQRGRRYARGELDADDIKD